VNPFALDADDELVDLAHVGALLWNEQIDNTRAMREKPMTIQFLSHEGPGVEPVDLGRPERAGPDPQE
jgi:hypothetical protein